MLDDGTKFGRYLILSKIGEGGMGEVYSADDQELGRSVAIKLLPAEFTNDQDRRSRFRQEARAASALNHPNIITIYEVGENEHGAFLVTELIDGPTLREVMNGGRQPLLASLKIVDQVANALTAAHNAHIIHRDIKPENIMVRRDSIVKVLDFGLAKPASDMPSLLNSDDNIKTVAGTVMGSARYMSPEQARGKTVDARTDVWSLGVILYEMATGKPPFDGETVSDTIAELIYKDPVPVSVLAPDAPPELDRIIRKSLAKDIDQRYPSASEFAADVKDLIYKIEHAEGKVNSFDSENRTMIQHGSLAGHLTDEPANPTLINTPAPATLAPRPRWILPAAMVAVVALAGIAVLTARWLMTDHRAQERNLFFRTQIARVDTDGKVRQPVISPDGKYLAYVSGEPGNQSVVVRQISTDSVVTVVPPTNLAFIGLTFTPSGDRIYYTLTGKDSVVSTLYQVPTLGGQPKKLIEDIDSPVTFSGDGKRFAFVRHVLDSNEDILFLANTDTLELQELIRSKAAGFDAIAPDPAWSPAADKILVATGKRGGMDNNSAVAIAEVDVASKQVRIVDDKKFSAIGNFAWFADGTGFLLTARESKNAPLQVWKSSYPTAAFRQVTNDFNDYSDVSLSSDGKTAAVSQGEVQSSLASYAPDKKELRPLTADGRTIYGMNGVAQLPDGSIVFTDKQNSGTVIEKMAKDGSSQKRLTEGAANEFSPEASPDGKYVVYVNFTGKSSTVWRVNADGGGALQLSNTAEGARDSAPQITADGKFVIFLREYDTEKCELMKMPLEGGQPDVLYQNSKYAFYLPRISPDGKQIAFVALDLKTLTKELQIATLDNYTFGKVVHTMPFELVRSFRWSPGGKDLTVLSNRNGSENIWTQPLDGDEPKQVTDLKSGRIFSFAWSTDGRSLLLARGSVVNDLLLIRDASPATQNNNSPPAIFLGR